MADETKRKVSDLARSIELQDGTLFFASAPDDASESGYTSQATSVEVLAEKLLGGIEYETDLETDAKNLFGAINELLGLAAYRAGDSVSFASPFSSFQGFINVTKKSLFFNIPLSKPILAESFSVSGQLTLRGNKGVINGGVAADLSGDGVTVLKIDNGISIRVDLDAEATNVDANVPISGMPLGGPVVISFS